MSAPCLHVEPSRPMPEKNARRQSRFNLIGTLVLVIGLAASAWIFVTAGDDASDVIGYQIVDGKSYPVTTADSKIYRHDLERFGGKAAIFADDLTRWLSSLWHGRRLALILAVLTIAVSFACFRAAERTSPGMGDEKDG